MEANKEYISLGEKKNQPRPIYSLFVRNEAKKER
jgi:hypothetical protein